MDRLANRSSNALAQSHVACRRADDARETAQRVLEEAWRRVAEVEESNRLLVTPAKRAAPSSSGIA